MVSTKVPTVTVPLFKDPTIVAALERHLAPFTGKSLERRQQAIARKHGEGIIGTTADLIATYIAASDASDPKGARDD